MNYANINTTWQESNDQESISSIFYIRRLLDYNQTIENIHREIAPLQQRHAYISEAISPIGFYEQAFTLFSEYIDLSVQLYILLLPFSDDFDSSYRIFTVRQFAAYAYAIASSNYHLSMDLLFGGRMGINPTMRSNTQPLTGLYFARAIALILLPFAVLKDMIPVLIGNLTYKKDEGNPNKLPEENS